MTWINISPCLLTYNAILKSIYHGIIKQRWSISNVFTRNALYRLFYGNLSISLSLKYNTRKKRIWVNLSRMNKRCVAYRQFSDRILPQRSASIVLAGKRTACARARLCTKKIVFSFTRLRQFVRELQPFKVSLRSPHRRTSVRSYRTRAIEIAIDDRLTSKHVLGRPCLFTTTLCHEVNDRALERLHNLDSDHVTFSAIVKSEKFHW